MGVSQRIRTELGINKTINVELEQDFNFIEILSLKIQQEDVYTKSCADYGVLVGRVTANNGFGVPNAKISIFIPIEDVDKSNPSITSIYPYTSPEDKNEDGYRYNLLPYEKSHTHHVPTGTFPSRYDALTNNTAIEIYDKYYKYTVKTNDSGDYMIMGAPLGTHIVFLDLDLSDIGEFSLTPQDLIRMGRATPSQVSGSQFRSSSDLNSLPQIVSLSKSVDISPLWGDATVCQIAITRTDFDLRDDVNIDIQPTSVFMGSIISSIDNKKLKNNCKPQTEMGNLCNLVAGPGQILCIRQTINNDSYGRPILEQYHFDGGDDVIESDGSWLLDLPMNLDYVVTNEFGEKVISNDPKIGIPTKAKYRFKVKWKQPDDLGQPVKRAYYLVPNIREYGWTSSMNDPKRLFGTLQYEQFVQSYAFSLDWNDYGDTGTTTGRKIIQSFIDCEDRFYPFEYNKVYTISNFIDLYHKGSNRGRYIGIKQITDSECDSTNYKFPTNDGSKNFDILFVLVNFIISIITYIFYPLIPVFHILALIFPIFKAIYVFVYVTIMYIIYALCRVVKLIRWRTKCTKPQSFKDVWNAIGANPFKKVKLPILTYPDCAMCECTTEDAESTENSPAYQQSQIASQNQSKSCIIDLQTGYSFDISSNDYCNLEPFLQGSSSDFCKYIHDDNYWIAGTTNAGAYQELLAGNGQDAYWKKTPGTVTGMRPEGDTATVSQDLTLAERLNLFNLKGKYFNYLPGSGPYGGWNQIKVKVRPDLPANNGKYHLDNVFMIIVDDSCSDLATTGNIVSFNGKDFSKDINIISGQTTYTTNAGDEIQTTSVTGLCKNLTQITVKYANPNNANSPAIPVNYVVDQSSGVTFSANNINYFEQKFATDIEYFQVITGMTMETFWSLNPSFSTGAYDDVNYGTLTNRPEYKSLRYRFTDNFNTMWMENFDNKCFSECGWYWSTSATYRPIYSMLDSKSFKIVFLTRGVDPHSVRQETEYDISKLFGKNFGNVIVKGEYKLNIPIQPGLKIPRHNEITNNELTSVGQPLFFESYFYQPTSSFSGYSTNLIANYSSLDATKINTFAVDGNSYSTLYSDRVSVDGDGALCAGGNNEFCNSDYEWFGVYSHFSNQTDRDYPVSMAPYSNSGDNGGADNGPSIPVNQYYLRNYGDGNRDRRHRSYYPGEYIEGGTYFYSYPVKLRYGGTDFEFWTWKEWGFVNYSPAYNTGTTTNFITGTQKIIMRSDRLPTSSIRTDTYGNNTFMAFQSTDFATYSYADNAELGFSYGNFSLGGDVNGDYTDDVTSPFEERVINTFTCNGLVPLGCYQNSGINFGVAPQGDSCYDKTHIYGGCYVFVDPPIFSIVRDWRQLPEWKSRFKVNLAACRGVFGHSFVNNWVNGTLFAFPFKNLRLFDSNNKPYNKYCEDVIMKHPTTNNFYYRSSPYSYNSSGGRFVGKNGPTNSKNDLQLLYPTTVMDLGPRDEFAYELNFSENYYGYNMNKMKTTTYQDISNLLNLFIISRQISSSFWQQFLSVSSASVNAFFSRDKSRFDGDYAQSISVNSEIAVDEFDFESYNYTYDNNLISQNSFFVGNKTMGVFYSSDTQTRDYITPRRIIRNDSSIPGVYDNLPIFSQEVPMYKWSIDTTTGYIFGGENNDWSTNSSGIQKKKYQSLDRLDINSGYFMGQSPIPKDFKGFIYNVDSNGGFQPLYGSGTLVNSQVVTVGSPFYFYFGLVRGNSSLDKFGKKYLGYENI